eukprot:5229064-Pyramimonas_sp.AAC.1
MEVRSGGGAPSENLPYLAMDTVDGGLRTWALRSGRLILLMILLLTLIGYYYYKYHLTHIRRLLLRRDVIWDMSWHTFNTQGCYTLNLGLFKGLKVTPLKKPHIVSTAENVIP